MKSYKRQIYDMLKYKLHFLNPDRLHHYIDLTPETAQELLIKLVLENKVKLTEHGYESIS